VVRTHEWAPRIGTRGIVKGTDETFAELARRHFGASLRARVTLTERGIHIPMLDESIGQNDSAIEPETLAE